MKLDVIKKSIEMTTIIRLIENPLYNIEDNLTALLIDVHLGKTMVLCSKEQFDKIIKSDIPRQMIFCYYQNNLIKVLKLYGKTGKFFAMVEV